VAAPLRGEPHIHGPETKKVTEVIKNKGDNDHAKLRIRDKEVSRGDQEFVRVYCMRKQVWGEREMKTPGAVTVKVIFCPKRNHHGPKENKCWPNGLGLMILLRAG